MRDNRAAMIEAKNEPSKNRLWEIAVAFLRLGFIAFGGAVAHIAMMEEEFVRRRGWLSREEIVDRVGAVNLLPGPSSTEMAIYLGYLRGGFPGLLVAGAAFILPSALMMCVMAWAYVRYGALPQIAGVLWGVKPVVVVLIAQAVWSLGKTVLKSRELMVIAVLVLGLAAVHVVTLALLIGTGVAWVVANRFGQSRDGQNGIAAAAAGAAGGAAGVASGAATAAATTSGVLVYFLKIGALLFGSGYVLLAVLREDLVTRTHWLTESQLLDGIAVSQATPGPFFTVATFLGYVLSGWSECCGGGVDGVCGISVCAGGCCDAVGGGHCGGQCAAGVLVSREFGLVDFGWGGLWVGGEDSWLELMREEGKSGVQQTRRRSEERRVGK